MVWKARTLLEEGSIELIVVTETPTFADLKIQSSESSFEVVYDLEKTEFSLTEESFHPADERKVRFSEQDECFTIPNRKGLSPSDREALWFRKAEMKRMRKREDNGEVDEEYEQFVTEEPPRNDELQEALHQLMAVSVVLDEQARQRREQICDPELISLKYRTFVERSRRSMFIANLAREEGDNQLQGKPLQIITDEPVQGSVDSL